MFTYDDALTYCKDMGVDPHKRGDNMYAGEHGSTTKDTPLTAQDMISNLKFPESTAQEIESIGNLINNLVSQKKTTIAGIKEMKYQTSLKDALRFLVPAFEIVWERECKKQKIKSSRFEVRHGKIYEYDPVEVKRVRKVIKEATEKDRYLSTLRPSTHPFSDYSEE